jgi:hypothetical protein
MYGMVALMTLPICPASEPGAQSRPVHSPYRAVLVLVIQLDLELADRLPALFDGTPDLRKEGDGRGLRLGEDVHLVRRHALLRDEHLLRAVDDKVAARVVRALVQVVEVLVSELAQQAVLGPEHDWHLLGVRISPWNGEGEDAGWCTLPIKGLFEPVRTSSD